MTGETDTSIDQQLVSNTEMYLALITNCVELVPELLESYPRQEDYQKIADEIRTLESKCDRRNRQIGALISNATVKEMGIRNTRIHVNSPQILGLYQQLDQIANIAEQIAEDLITIRPDIAPYLHFYEEMANCSTTAMKALKNAIMTFITLLCAYDQTGTITDDIQIVRDAESSCDAIRNELIANVFADDDVTQPMVHREFALLFNQLTDTLEDITDRLVLISSTESWITTEQNYDH